MDYLLYLGVLISIFAIIISQLLVTQKKIEHKNKPPSPPALPIIGHFHLLKRPLHQSLNNLSTKYGPIFLLRLGSRPSVVLSTRSAIEECFAKNDTAFSNRPLLPSKRTSSYIFTRLASSYGDHWRNFRRFFSLEIFSAKSLQMSSNMRVEEVRFMIKHLHKMSNMKGVEKLVDVKTLLYMLDFNIIMRMVSGTRCFEFEEEGLMGLDAAKAKLDDLSKMFSPEMRMALGDYFPFLRWFSYFGLEKKLIKLHKKGDVFLQALLDAHPNPNKTHSVSDGEGGGTILGALLKLQESQPEFYSHNMIKGMVQLILRAGTYSTVSTMTRIISRLISHPEVLKKARDEIDKIVGESRLLNDDDLPKLAYLHCIINETLRLYTAEHISPPRESSEECSIAGYNIPTGTQLLVNLWGVHMDPELWKDSHSFKPERFQEKEEENRRYKFIPFGVGRRQCPGEGLAMRVMALTLGTLIQCFEWEIAEEGSHDEVGSSKIIFQPREKLIKVLHQL